MSVRRWRPAIESALTLDLRLLKAQGAVGPGVRSGELEWRGRDQQIIYAIRYQSYLDDDGGRLHFTDIDGGNQYSIALLSTRVNFGGRRFWFCCPLTGRRALKLHRYEAIGKFFHRTVIRPLPTYASQRVSGLERVLERRWAIRRKLGDFGTLFDPLQKPKWMRWDTFERYAAKDKLLELEDYSAILQRIRRC